MKFNSSEKDVLQEVFNIGAGHAATALSQMTKSPVGMGVPKVQTATLAEVEEVVSDPGRIAIHLAIVGDITASLWFVLAQDDALELAGLVMGGAPASLDEIALSAVMEMGNIITGAFLVAITTMSGINMVASVPTTCWPALPKEKQGESDREGQGAIVIGTEFSGTNCPGGFGQIILMPDSEGAKVLFKALEVV